MHLFRKIKESDVDDVYRLAMEAHAGITSLPKNRKLIEEKVANSLLDKLHFFGLEDLKEKKLIVISAIKTHKTPFEYYKISSELIHRQDKEPFSELCSLYLQRNVRHAGLGKLLSLARFLYIKSHRTLFDKILRAFLRGVFNEKDESPFWKHVGFQRALMPYEEFVNLAKKNPELLLQAVPASIAIEDLPKEAQKVIGVPHKNTVPARHLLENQGLYFDDEIDLLDGGPILKGEIDTLKPITDSMLTEVYAIEPLKEGASIIASLEPFGAALGNAYFGEEGVTIDPVIAKTLSLTIGSPVLYLKLE